MSVTVQYIIVIAMYFVAMMLIGFLFSNASKSEKDYFLAKDKLPPSVIGFSYSATQMSGSSYLGCVGTVHSTGLPYLPVNIASAAAPWFCYVLVGDRVCRVSNRLKMLSISDIFEARFGKSAGLASSIIILIATVPVLTAQLKAAGTSFETIIGIPYLLAIFIFGAIVIIYTLAGGMFAVAWTDLVQGILMILGFAILLPIVVPAAGGLTNAMEAYRINNPAFASFDGGGKPMLWVISALLVWGFYQIGGQPAAVTRFQTTTETKTLKKSLIYSIFFQSFIYISVTILGICSMALFPDLAVADQALPNLINNFLPPIVGGIVLAAALGAMMSTIDSVLLMASSVFVNNIWVKALKRKSYDKAAVKAGRIVVIVLGIVGICFAINPPDAILWIITMGFSIMAGAFTFPLLIGLWSKKITQAGGFWGIIGGATTTLIWYIISYIQHGNLNDYVWGIWPAIVGSIFSLIVMFAVSSSTPKIPEDVEEAFFAEEYVL